MVLLEPFLASKAFIAAAPPLLLDALFRGLSRISKSSELFSSPSVEIILDSEFAAPAAAPAPAERGLKLCVPLIMSESLTVFFPLAS
jgi:hypothetical protein